MQEEQALLVHALLADRGGDDSVVCGVDTQQLRSASQVLRDKRAWVARRRAARGEAPAPRGLLQRILRHISSALG